MTKIEIEIPEWVIGKNISIVAGGELVAKMYSHSKKTRLENGEILREKGWSPMKIKLNNSDRCNGCGDCCNSGGPRSLMETLGYKYVQGKPCPLLGPQGCSLGAFIPLACVIADCTGYSENCSEKLVQLEVF